MNVAAVLRQKGAAVISVLPETTVADAAQVIVDRRIGAVVVLDAAGRLAGILSERDVVRGLTRFGTDLLTTRVDVLMTQEVTMATLAMTVEEAVRIMDQGYFRHLPVQGEDGALCGIVSIRDLARYLIGAQQSDVESLQAYVMGRGYATGRV
jgi:CBS domain-containing protein